MPRHGPDFPTRSSSSRAATRFENGDSITILEVQGTADRFAADNLYMIKGAYTLASHDQAMLAAYVTAKDPENGTGASHKYQTTFVNRGKGTFTLFLPMSYRGWPHVSFYLDGGRGSFGGNYFGSGDSVLKRWWDGGHTDQRARRSGGRAGRRIAPGEKPETRESSGLPTAVRFEQGATNFVSGDRITITEVRGTADRFAPGNLYMIKGTYTLASHHQAMLAAYVTAKDAENGRGASQRSQMTNVNRGQGTFTLFLPMSCRGWPHVSFYPDGGGESFGGNYFGTDDSVLKRWWGSQGSD